jgi:hypothetical protein
MNGFEDFCVASAPAEIAGERVLDIVIRRFGVPFEQSLGSEYHPRRAEPALDRSPIYKGPLDGMEIFAGSQSLNGQDIGSIGFQSQGQARTYGMAVQQHGA